MQRNSNNTQRDHSTNKPRQRSLMILAMMAFLCSGGIALASHGSTQKSGNLPQAKPSLIGIDKESIPVNKNNESGIVKTVPSEESQNSAKSTSMSTSTVTINGTTTTLHGNGSIHESYSTNNGQGQVSISIDHTSNSTSGRGESMD